MKDTGAYKKACTSPHFWWADRSSEDILSELPGAVVCLRCCSECWRRCHGESVTSRCSVFPTWRRYGERCRHRYSGGLYLARTAAKCPLRPIVSNRNKTLKLIFIWYPWPRLFLLLATPLTFSIGCQWATFKSNTRRLANFETRILRFGLWPFQNDCTHSKYHILNTFLSGKVIIHSTCRMERILFSWENTS